MPTARVEHRQDVVASPFSRLEWIVPAAEGQRHEPDARLDQPAGQQGALAPLVAAVAVAEAGALLADVERGAGGGAGDHRERLLAEPVEAVHQARGVDVAAGVVEGVQQAAAAVEPGGVDARRAARGSGRW